MDISLFYQLKERLTASAVTGCATINEDFRLQRAIEAFEPLSKANKAFAKLYNMCGELLKSPNPAPILADCIALCDALAVTQATFKDNSETHAEKGVSTCKPYPVRYLSIHGSASNWARTFNSTDENTVPESYNDPRILSLVINNLGNFGNATETINKIMDYLSRFGKDIVPIIKEKLDPTESKTGGQIVRCVVSVAGAEETDWYNELIDTEQNAVNVKVAAVKGLGCDVANAERLLEIYNTAKGDVKNAAALELVKMDVPEAEPILKKVTGKKITSTSAELIAFSRNPIAIEFAIKTAWELNSQLKEKDNKVTDGQISNVLRMLLNKPEAEEVIMALASERKSDSSDIPTAVCEILMLNTILNKDEVYRTLIKNLYDKNNDLFALPYLYLLAVENREYSFLDFPELTDKFRLSLLNMFSSLQYNKSRECYTICARIAWSAYSHIDSKEMLRDVADGRIDDIIKFIADKSYFKYADGLLSGCKKRTVRGIYGDMVKLNEKDYVQRCIQLADSVIRNLYYCAADSDKEKIRDAATKFCVEAVKICDSKQSLLTLCLVNTQYIIDNPQLVSDAILQRVYDGGYFARAELSELPKDIIPELQKVLDKLKSKNSKERHIVNQINALENFIL